MAERTIRSAALAERPSAYQRWRRGRLGRMTDALEQDLVLDLVGPVAGLRVLDIGCGDGQLALALARRRQDVGGRCRPARPGDGTSWAGAG